jgi:hypothetical protein
VDEARRAPFLHHRQGQAGSLDGEQGECVIALRRTGSCSVFARFVPTTAPSEQVAIQAVATPSATQQQ